VAVSPGTGEAQLENGNTLLVEGLGGEEAYLVRAQPARTDRARIAGGRASAVLGLELLGVPRARAELSGERLTLRMRHSEILTLLCAHPEGMSSEELSEAIHGHRGGSPSIRVELSRLRKLLPDCIEPEHYRLRCAVSSDFAQVCGLLHRGEVGEAALHYRGPLLPESRAPGVVREREELERWLRQSVMSAGDSEALWAWLQTPSGDVDLGGWQRLLANVPFHDPRRSLAAARLGTLRSAADPADVAHNGV
jgi:hypothetical protein